MFDMASVEGKVGGRRCCNPDGRGQHHEAGHFHAAGQPRNGRACKFRQECGVLPIVACDLQWNWRWQSG
jgi:hypothetical protein